MQLEELIRDACTKGRLTHLTLAPTRDGKWQAAYSDARRSSGYSIAIHKDPIEAIKESFNPRRHLAAATTEAIRKEIEDLI